MGKQIRKTMVHYVIGTTILLSLYLFVDYLVPAQLRISDMRKIIIGAMCVAFVEVIPFGNLDKYHEYAKQHKWIMLVKAIFYAVIVSFIAF